MSIPSGPLSFFAIIQDSGSESINLLRTTNDVQTKLTDIFLKGAEKLSEPSLDRVPFTQSYNTDESEIFSISDFVLSAGVESAIDDPASVDSLNLSSGDLPPIKAIFTGWKTSNGELSVAYQLFKKNQYLTRSGVSLILSSGTFNELATPGIIISYEIVAFYDNGELLFNSYYQARQVLELAQHYRQATQSDIDSFVSNDSVVVEDVAAFNAMADTWVRRKLAIIQDGGLLDSISVSDIVSKASEFDIAISTRTEDGVEVIEVPEDKKAVKELLRFLDEDYFEGSLSAAKYLSNSKRTA